MTVGTPARAGEGIADDLGEAVTTVVAWLAAGKAAVWNVSNAGEALRPAIDQANEDGIPFIGTYAGNEVGSIDIREASWPDIVRRGVLILAVSASGILNKLFRQASRTGGNP